MSNDKPYTKREIDSIMDRWDKTLTELSRNVNSFIGVQNETNEENEKRISSVETEIKVHRTTAKVAYWAFGITIPLILTMGIWIFFNEIQHMQQQLQQVIQYNAKQTNEKD